MGNPYLPIDKQMVVRTAILLLAWVNQFLLIKGLSPLPIDDATTEFVVSSLLTFGASMWSWWKNNAVTLNARKVEKIAEKEGLK